MRTWTKLVVALATIGLIGCLVAWSFSKWRHSTNSSRIQQNLTLWEQSQEYQDYGMSTNKPWDRNWTSSEPRSVYQDYDISTYKPLEESPEDGKNTSKASSEQSQEYQDYGMSTNKPWDRNWTSSEPRSVYQDYDISTYKPLEESPEDGKNTSKASSEQSQEYQDYGMSTNKPWDRNWTSSEPRSVYQDYDISTYKPLEESPEDGKNTSKASSEQSQEYQDYGMSTNKPWDRNWTSSEPRSVYQDYDISTYKPLEESPEDGKNTSKASSEQSQEYRMDTNNTLYRMNTVREMMRHAWNNYKRYAWGKNELEIFSATIHTSFWFRDGELGATIVDGLDTLYLMGMMKEFREGRNWVKDHLHISKNDTLLEVHTTINRYIGGLLSCYALTGDSVFKDKAVEVADVLLPAFDTPVGLPFRFINPFTKRARQYPDRRGHKSVLSEVGALHLEFSYLSDVTGNTVYKKKVDAIRNVLFKTEKPGGLYPNFIYFRTGQLERRETSLGEDGGPFYEYLLKAWLISGKEDEQGRKMFDTAMQVALDKLLTTSPSGLAYLVELRDGKILKENMEHFSCFSGAMFALASTTLENSMSARYMEVAENLTNTCHESYTRTKTKLGPKKITFSDMEEARRRTPIKGGVHINVYYMLWPETFQSYFILWRLTRKQQYRDWGWEAVEALEKHCRVEGGYSGLEDVYNEQSRHYDLQQTYFLSETLKYLYLLFADDSLLPLEDWVLNRAAHPLPVKGKNPFYRAATLENEENENTENQDYDYAYNEWAKAHDHNYENTEV